MPTVRGIASFPAIFTPKVPKGATEAKYGISLLFPPNDPEAMKVKAEFDMVKNAAYPSGVPRTSDVCFGSYHDKYVGKEYYDPKLKDWWVLSCSASAAQKPPVVDQSHQPILDPASVPAGMLVWVSFNMSAYAKGTGGIGGWLNGVMSTGEMGQLGRLDNKPTVDQMFGNVTGGAPQQTAYAPAPPAAYAPPPPVPAAPPAAVARIMTAAANGSSYEAMITAGWTDALLLQHGMMIAPSFA
jgi:hypothetical protein